MSIVASVIDESIVFTAAVAIEITFPPSTGVSAALAPVNLPHGSVITAVVVYGSDTGDIWTLRNADNVDGGNVISMATAAVNTIDSSITDATIDNQNSMYWLAIPNIDAGNLIYSAKITYTTDYI